MHKARSRLVRQWVSLALLAAAPGPASARDEDVEASLSKSVQSGSSAALRLGPTLQVGGPIAISYGIDGLLKRRWGFSVTTGQSSAARTEDMTVGSDVRIRWHPEADGAFVGLALGRQGFLARRSAALAINSGDLTLKIPTTVQVRVDVLQVTPHLGWYAVTDEGWVFGCEAGMRIPLRSKSAMSAAFEGSVPSQYDAVRQSEAFRSLEAEVKDAGVRFRFSSLLYVTLLRVGWLF